MAPHRDAKLQHGQASSSVTATCIAYSSRLPQHATSAQAVLADRAC